MAAKHILCALLAAAAVSVVVEARMFHDGGCRMDQNNLRGTATNDIDLQQQL